MHRETILKNNDRYEITIKHQMTLDYKYRAIVTVSLADSSMCEFSCLTIQLVRWDVQCDGWHELRSLGFKRVDIN